MVAGNESDLVQRKYLKIAASYSLPIFWANSDGILGNGTAFILDTGANRFVVTGADGVQLKINQQVSEFYS